MLTQQLLDYINQQLESRVSKEQIKKTLIANGWDEKDVDLALKRIGAFSGGNQSKLFTKLPKVAVIGAVMIILVVGSICAYNIFFETSLTPSQPKELPQPTLPVKLTGRLANEPVDFIQPYSPYALVISGEIKKGYSDIKLNSFFFVTSITEGLAKEEASSEAQFEILLKKNGKTFYKDNFDANYCVDWSPGDYCGKFDHSYGFFVHALDGISQLPDEIVIQHLDKDIYSLKEPTTPFPSMALLNQEYKNGSIKISWEVKGDYKKLNYLAYVSNNDFQAADFSSTGKTMALLEDSINKEGTDVFGKNSFNFQHKGYIEGDLQVAIYATDGFRTRVAYSDKFTTEKAQVQAKIRFPEAGKTYGQNYVPLEAISFDPRTGLRCGGCPKEGNTFIWTSSLDGVISTSHDTHCQFLTPGDHKITLQVKNENGTEASTSVDITVDPVDIISEAETKARQEKGQTCSD